MARQRADGIRVVADQEDDRADNATAAIPEILGTRSDEELFHQANAYLAGKLKSPENEEPKALFQRFLSGVAVRPLMRAVHEKRIEAFEIFYAGAQMLESAANRDEFIQIVCEATNTKSRTNTDPFSLVARCVFSYGKRDERGRLDPEARRRWH